ncbi:MAG: hypothetical protein HYV00_09785 [Deltaproteobacteria bacterium]|nr:hypothetical protein [Deltaproteobacteria bacterium]
MAPSQRQVQAHDEAHEPLTKVEREILAACAGAVNWIIETKGREWEDTLAKDAAISDWCKKVSAQTGIP